MRRARLLAALAGAALVAAIATPAYADAAEIKASELSSADVVLTEDTTLIMDADVTFTHIGSAEDDTDGDGKPNYYALTVEGPNALKVVNPDGIGVSVKSIQCNTDVVVDVNGLYGIYLDEGGAFVGDYDVKATAERSYGLYGNTGDVSITGDVKAYGDHGGIYLFGRGSNLSIEGDIDAGAGYDSGIYVSNGKANIVGNVYAHSGGWCGVCAYGGVTIDGDFEAEAREGMYAGKVVDISGNVKVKAEQYGIYAFAYTYLEGDEYIYIGGDVEIEALNCGINANMNDPCHIVGDVNIVVGAEDGSSGWTCIYAPDLTIDGTVTAINKNPKGGDCLYAGRGNMVLNGDVVAKGSSMPIYVYPGVLTARGSVYAETGSFEAFYLGGGADFYGDVTAIGPSYGIYNYRGGVRFHGGTANVTATSETGWGISSYDGVVCDDADIKVSGGQGGISAHSYSSGAGYGVVVANSGRIDATGGTYAIISENEIQIDEPLRIKEPAGGQVIPYAMPSSSGYWDVYTIGDADGAVAPHALIVAPPPAVTRIAGDYANETAAAISATAFPDGSEWVVIARDDDFADALGATGLAGTLECPIVLTGRTGLSEAAAEEIGRLGAKHAYIIGGTGAIKDQVDADLAALGVTVEPRVWGENSYDTSLACAKKISELGGNQIGVFVAMSSNFQDALSISPFAYMWKAPLVLQTWGATSADRGFTDEAAAWLAGRNPIVVGGPGAISEESISSVAFSGDVLRLYGETGYDTSNAIAEWAVAGRMLTDSAAVFACGAQAPKGVDALAGSALAGRLGCPILLVNGNEEMEAVDTTTIDGYFADHADACRDIYILGGEYVMPASIVDKIQALYVLYE